MTRLYVLMVLGLTLSTFAAHAVDRAGGGGNIYSKKEFKADPQDAWKFELEPMLRELKGEVKPGAVLPIRGDVQVADIAKKIVALPEVDQFMDSFKGGKENGIELVRQNAPCYDNGKPRDASVIKGARNPIRLCLSEGRLKGLPTVMLKKRMAALVLHELAHVASADEKVAVKMQTFAVHVMPRQCRAEIWFENTPTQYRQVYILLRNPSYSSEDSAYSGEQWRVSYFQRKINEWTSHFSLARNMDSKNGLISIDPKGNSKIVFEMMNTDGSVSTQELTWGPFPDYYGPYNYEIYDIPFQGNITLDGKVLPVHSVHVRGCDNMIYPTDTLDTNVED